jgi:NRAMP (natural resistance-associated macrophage protein)-like metal ion transporter
METSSRPAEADPTTPPSLLHALGPGLITGAADDDPSGIATYSQAGAQLGYGMTWVMLFSYPLMAVTQVIAARIGAVTGQGIARNLRLHYPGWVLKGAVALLLVANVANLGADLGAMASGLQLLIGGPIAPYTVAFALLCVVAEIFISYARYASLLKWLTLALFAYVGVVFAVHVPWGEALKSLVIPRMSMDSASAEVLVAILGTTISPYLFFWQASQEVEEQRQHNTARLMDNPDAPRELRRIDIDTWVGMGYSNLIALFIIVATAATLHAAGKTDIATARDAAEALRPIAGVATFWLFAAGIIGTGLLAVPVLAGSAAYAISEVFGWAEGLDFKLRQARGFYATITLATIVGMALNFVGIDPIKALYWSAVLNGILATPLMVVMLLVATNSQVMGKLVLPRWLRVVGWLAAAVMLVATVGFFLL